MTNPVARLWEVHYKDKERGDYIEKSVLTFCPACNRAHPFCIDNGGGVRSDGTARPTWEWDGNLESPTFSPSMLCYYTVLLCEASHTTEPCEDHDSCEEKSHKITNYHDVASEDDWKYGHGRTNHPEPCTWGNCHSFLRAGVWDFLSDCAHDKAGQQVPMVPLSDFLMKRGF